MNIYRSRCIRPLLWSVSAALLITAGAAQGRPTDPGWFGPPAVKGGGPQACGKIWKPATYGPGTGQKAIWVVERDLGSCPRQEGEKPVTGYRGPRNTIPVR